MCWRVKKNSARFQSTRPIRGATFNARVVFIILRHFNPRAPYGARRNSVRGYHGGDKFQSTRPIRGATTPSVTLWPVYLFQSTRPIRGATTAAGVTVMLVDDFNPRAPYGARLEYQQKLNNWLTGDFNPRAPYGARQQKCIIYVLHFCNNRQSKHKNQQETSSVRTFF